VTVCEAIDLEEIMAEKIIALSYRRYLGGRDLFDLWFHWLRAEDDADRRDKILSLLEKKLKERKIARPDLIHRLDLRLSEKAPLDRARIEWKRYLPADFQHASVLDDILGRCRNLREIVT
jgi:predicted nucleotidyltransferase component of viral defense system